MSYGEPNYTPSEPYTPGPDYSQEVSQQPPHQQPQPFVQHPENDGPIEYDPVGQGLISAGAGIVQAGFSAAGTFLGNLAEEGAAWLGGEDVLAFGEAVADQPSNNLGTGGASTGSDTGSDPGDGSDSTSADYDDQSADDPNMSVDPDMSDPDMCVDPGAGDYSGE